MPALSTAPAQLPGFPVPGMTLLVDPASVLSVLLWLPAPGLGQAAGSAALPLAVPPTAGGISFYLQVLVADAMGPGGIAASNGLELRIGN